MDALMLEGWTPILLVGIVIALIVFFISRKISRKALFFISWEGMGLGFVTFSGFLGIWIGTIIGVITKK